MKTPSLTGIKDEGRALQIEGERNLVGPDSNTLADTVMVVNFVPVVCQLVCGGQKLTKTNASVGASVINAGINQSLTNEIR